MNNATTTNGRKRSRTNSNPNNLTPLSALRRPIADPSHPPRLLRLNVGGLPYDVVRTALPLLETMMTDRWLDTCLYDGDGRIFLDRDGEAFGDVLRCLRSPDFLGCLKRSSSGGMDRLRRLRSEADYYGLHDSLVRQIDDVTVGQRVVLEGGGWARVAGGCLVRNVGIEEGEGGNALRGGQQGNPNAANNAAEEENDAEENNNDPNNDADANNNDEQNQDEDAMDDNNGAQVDEDEENNDEGDEEEADEEVSANNTTNLSWYISFIDSSLNISPALLRYHNTGAV